MKKIIFLNTHPVQYSAPLYAKMVDLGMQLEVWYCSDESIRGGQDKQFGLSVKWDIPLLEGYHYRFFKNHAKWGSIHSGFWGLQNWGLLKAILREPRSLVVIQGWGYFIQIIFVLAAKLKGHQTAIRCEAPLHQELLKNKKARRLRRFFFEHFLFKLINYFFYIGQHNREFYKFYGIDECQLFFTPYAVDNARFQQAAELLLPQKKALRISLGLPPQAKLILFVGKYIDKKRPLDLIQAFGRLEVPNKVLVMVGEGQLRAKMEELIETQQLENVFLTGFINQTEIVKYYAVADVFVMCSGEGETWGLSANEAMNFGLPIVLSDMVGCAADLVPTHLAEKYIFPLGDLERLTNCLASACDEKEQNQWPRQVIDNYSYENVACSFAKVTGSSIKKDNTVVNGR